MIVLRLFFVFEAFSFGLLFFFLLVTYTPLFAHWSRSMRVQFACLLFFYISREGERKGSHEVDGDFLPL